MAVKLICVCVCVDVKVRTANKYPCLIVPICTAYTIVNIAIFITSVKEGIFYTAFVCLSVTLLTA